MWFYLIGQHSLYCLNTHTLNMQHTKEPVKCQVHCSIYPEKFSCCSTLPGTPSFRTNLVMLKALNRFLPPREGASNCSSVRLPWNAHPQFKPSLKKTTTSTALASGAQGGHSCVFFCKHIWDSYTPIESASPFIRSS